jgi:hypothetical protein
MGAFLVDVFLFVLRFDAGRLRFSSPREITPKKKGVLACAPAEFEDTSCTPSFHPRHDQRGATA